MISKVGLDFVKQAYDMPQGGYPQYPMYPQQPAISISYSNMPQHGNYMYDYRHWDNRGTNYRNWNNQGSRNWDNQGSSNWNNQGNGNPSGLSNQEWQRQIELAREQAIKHEQARQELAWYRANAKQKAPAPSPVHVQSLAEQQQTGGMARRALRAATGIEGAQKAHNVGQKVLHDIKNLFSENPQPAAPVKTASLNIKEAALLGSMGTLLRNGVGHFIPGMNMAYNATKRFIQPYANKAISAMQPYANRAMSVVQPYATRAYNAVSPYATKAYNTVQPYAQQAMNNVTNFARTGVQNFRTGFNSVFKPSPLQSVGAVQ